MKIKSFRKKYLRINRGMRFKMVFQNLLSEKKTQKVIFNSISYIMISSTKRRITYNNTEN